MTETRSRRPRLSLSEYIEGVREGDRVTLARAITLVESEHRSDREAAAELLDQLLPYTGNSYRIGITGIPGAGKSTFIDALGLHVIQHHSERLAVLTVDPSSQLSAGSILGDKTRMERLAALTSAFIRPSPARGHLGGVARRSREAILLCEAAGYTTILVETIGVGQSETAVREMTDFFLLLAIPGAGDELQGIKRGILELIDGMAINKADGDNIPRALQAASDYTGALQLFGRREDDWQPRVLTCSAREDHGIAEVWQLIGEHREQQMQSGAHEGRRTKQNESWLQELIQERLARLFHESPQVQSEVDKAVRNVRERRITPVSAANNLMRSFQSFD